MTYIRVYGYMYALCIIPHYQFFIVYINPITTFIVYIITFYSMFYAFEAILFYCTLSEVTIIKKVLEETFSCWPSTCDDTATSGTNPLTRAKSSKFKQHFYMDSCLPIYMYTRKWFNWIHSRNTSHFETDKGLQISCRWFHDLQTLPFFTLRYV